MDAPQPTHFMKATLKERGWTDAMIKRFLGAPDSTKTNPRYRSGSPMCLYAIERVLTAEGSPDFDAAKAKAATRSAASTVRADKARVELVRTIETVEIRIEHLDIDEVRSCAIDSYNHAPKRERDGRHATPDASPSFLDRIAVNFIRHELADYDGIIAQLGGRIGKREAYRTLRRRVLAEIARLYPILADAARAQGRR